jgi:putative addiction module CopG family antidote
MKVTLRPEFEELVKQDVQRGPYRSLDEFVEYAISMLHEQEACLAEHSADIKEKIEEGYAFALRGELMGGDEVKFEMDKRKAAWLADRRQP